MWLKPDPPRVSCKQVRSDFTPAPPKADGWLEETPVLGRDQGAVRLSEQALVWVNDILVLLNVERTSRRNEHGCLDKSEKAGLIRQ